MSIAKVLIAAFVVLSIVAPRLPGLREVRPSRRSMRRFSLVWSARWLSFGAFCVLIAVSSSWWPVRVFGGCLALLAVGCGGVFAWNGRNLGSMTDEEYGNLRSE